MCWFVERCRIESGCIGGGLLRKEKGIASSRVKSSDLICENRYLLF